MPNLGFKVKTFLRWISQNCAFYIVQLQIIYLTSSVSATASQSLSDSWLSCIFLYDFSVLYWQLTYWLAACLLFFCHTQQHVAFYCFYVLYCFVAVAASFLYFGIWPKLGFHTVTNALSVTTVFYTNVDCCELWVTFVRVNKLLKNFVC